MKKVLTWVGIFLGVVVLGVMIRYGIPLLFAVLFVTGLEHEWDSLNDPAEQALTDLGLTAYVEHAPWNDLTIDGVLTAFELDKFDYGTEVYVRDGVMAHAAASDVWHVTETTAAEYMEHVKTYIPEAAFLQPSDGLVFDAKYMNFGGTDPSNIAFFDQDTGLLIYLCISTQPHAGSVRADQLTVPTDGWVYELETHSGFLGDGKTYRAFIVPEEGRSSLEATLSSHADWHEGFVTHDEYVHLHDHELYGVPGLYPDESVTFDWWCYVDTFARANPDDVTTYIPDNSDFPAVMREAGARPGGNWLIALYDADTGLFIFYQYDS